MAFTDAPAQTAAFVHATVRFTDPASAGAALDLHDYSSSGFRLVPKTVRIGHARAGQAELSFQVNGFTLLRHDAHSAFEDPTSRPNAPPRLSHEVRTIAFLD